MRPRIYWLLVALLLILSCDKFIIPNAQLFIANNTGYEVEVWNNDERHLATLDPYRSTCWVWLDQDLDGETYILYVFRCNIDESPWQKKKITVRWEPDEEKRKYIEVVDEWGNSHCVDAAFYIGGKRDWPPD